MQMLSITPLPPPSRRLVDPAGGDASRRRSFVGGDDDEDDDDGTTTTSGSAPAAGDATALRIFSGRDSRELTYASTIRCSSRTGDGHQRASLAPPRRRSRRPNLHADDDIEASTGRRPSLTPPRAAGRPDAAGRRRW
jgi:hypothetical protein